MVLCGPDQWQSVGYMRSISQRHWLCLADGRLLHAAGRSLALIDADPAHMRLIGNPIDLSVGNSISPVLLGGIAYIRGSEHLYAVDLRR